MDMKKLFHVLVVGGAVIGTGGGCAKPKASEAAPAQTPSAQTPPSAAATTPKPDSDTNGTPQAQPQEKGGGANGW